MYMHTDNHTTPAKLLLQQNSVIFHMYKKGSIATLYIVSCKLIMIVLLLTFLNKGSQKSVTFFSL